MQVKVHTTDQKSLQDLEIGDAVCIELNDKFFERKISEITENEIEFNDPIVDIENGQIKTLILGLSK